jgi:exosortase A-associated hydrolase 2
VRGAIVHLPAFGEEMNKSRRMTALAARALAARGFGVLQLDPSGTGDSDGDFADGSFERWAGELAAGAAWAGARSDGPLWLWALRAGALLAGPVLERLAVPAGVALWQPVQSGAQFLTHLLRQKHAGELADAGPGALDGLRRDLRVKPVEIGGYAITPALGASLGQAALQLPLDRVTRLAWLEVTTATPPALSPAARTKVAALRSEGIAVAAQAVAGPSFWQSAEIEEAPALLDATCGALTDEMAYEHA